MLTAILINFGLFSLFPCLINWTRVLLRCQGKLLRGSGLDDALVECGVFGPGVIETVLNGSHYVRALTGMLMVEDLINKLEWQAFWTRKDKATYLVLEQMKELQNMLVANERCQEQFKVMGRWNNCIKTFLIFRKNVRLCLSFVNSVAFGCS
ncbi:hypothetical protein DPMN_187547 [Dreissena polymorpha]|uniref:Uncharacterized protein n=1 Tax=Dreissena polymorpha TaxID=45954 RepID=A0A9D4I7M1_DREPO|nr:hypothetical protein DPMN_187547 [Dreissena polymorpha]